ncbi:RodZ domain-containing protein [Enterococcus rivorum]|uniref:Transcriptional regulator n=1 Tax=Enterococcus rivorum TaxID=762845 RepID=A0A1E5L020_9ENTE|nr:RodZ domain-containing protein [Enterococcus rivorum]MBP2100237.1 cytoskeletal protein RodZ [Enterococcus rivorum]OEH83458.1 transcriptional regulator [Enterococcus rivorum]
MASINIGEKLREARLQKNMSLDELQQITKVQKRYLMAVEDNDFDSMPGTFYVRAFIRQYANAVGLNGAELVDIFDGKDVPEDIESVIQFEELGDSRSRLYEEENRSSRLVKSLPAIVFSLIGLAIAVTVFYVTWLDGKSNPIIQQPAAGVSVDNSVKVSSSLSSESQSSTESSTTESRSSEEKTNIKFDSETGSIVNMSVTEAKDPIKLEFTGKNATGWIGVSVDGAYTYQYTLNPGEKQETELPAGATNATITLGASGNTEVMLNGEKLDFNPNNTLASRKDIILTISYKL